LPLIWYPFVVRHVRLACVDLRAFAARENGVLGGGRVRAGVGFVFGSVEPVYRGFVPAWHEVSVGIDRDLDAKEVRLVFLRCLFVARLLQDAQGWVNGEVPCPYN